MVTAGLYYRGGCEHLLGYRHYVFKRLRVSPFKPESFCNYCSTNLPWMNKAVSPLLPVREKKKKIFKDMGQWTQKMAAA